MLGLKSSGYKCQENFGDGSIFGKETTTKNCLFGLGPMLSAFPQEQLEAQAAENLTDVQKERETERERARRTVRHRSS